MTKNEFHELEIPIYGSKILICLSDEPWTSLRNAKLPRGGYKKNEAALCDAWVEETSKLVTTPLGSQVRWIVAMKPGADLNTVAHECYHLTNFLTQWFGIAREPGEDEAAAYIHGWLMERLWTIKTDACSGTEPSSLDPLS